MCEASIKEEAWVLNENRRLYKTDSDSDSADDDVVSLQRTWWGEFLSMEDITGSPKSSSHRSKISWSDLLDRLILINYSRSSELFSNNIVEYIDNNIFGDFVNIFTNVYSLKKTSIMSQDSSLVKPTVTECSDLNCVFLFKGAHETTGGLNDILQLSPKCAGEILGEVLEKLGLSWRFANATVGESSFSISVPCRDGVDSTGNFIPGYVNNSAVDARIEMAHVIIDIDSEEEEEERSYTKFWRSLELELQSCSTINAWEITMLSFPEFQVVGSTRMTINNRRIVFNNTDSEGTTSVTTDLSTIETCLERVASESRDGAINNNINVASGACTNELDRGILAAMGREFRRETRNNNKNCASTATVARTERIPESSARRRNVFLTVGQSWFPLLLFYLPEDLQVLLFADFDPAELLRIIFRFEFSEVFGNLLISRFNNIKSNINSSVTLELFFLALGISVRKTLKRALVMLQSKKFEEEVTLRHFLQSLLRDPLHKAYRAYLREADGDNNKSNALASLIPFVYKEFLSYGWQTPMASSNQNDSSWLWSNQDFFFASTEDSIVFTRLSYFFALFAALRKRKAVVFRHMNLCIEKEADDLLADLRKVSAKLSFMNWSNVLNYVQLQDVVKEEEEDSDSKPKKALLKYCSDDCCMFESYSDARMRYGLSRLLRGAHGWREMLEWKQGRRENLDNLNANKNIYDEEDLATSPVSGSGRFFVGERSPVDSPLLSCSDWKALNLKNASNSVSKFSNSINNNNNNNNIPSVQSFESVDDCGIEKLESTDVEFRRSEDNDEGLVFEIVW